MPLDEQWLAEQQREIARKRDLLATLEERLAGWQAQGSLADLSPEKRLALENLARESVDLLQTMIARVEQELQENPQALSRPGLNGHAPQPPVDRRRE
jgi:hypothetical protein